MSIKSTIKTLQSFFMNRANITFIIISATTIIFWGILVSVVLLFADPLSKWDGVTSIGTVALALGAFAWSLRGSTILLAFLRLVSKILTILLGIKLAIKKPSFARLVLGKAVDQKIKLMAFALAVAAGSRALDVGFFLVFSLPIATEGHLSLLTLAALLIVGLLLADTILAVWRYKTGLYGSDSAEVLEAIHFVQSRDSGFGGPGSFHKIFPEAEASGRELSDVPNGIRGVPL